MRDQIIQELDKIKMPNGQSIVALDMVRALTIDEGHVQFVIEAPSAAVAGALESLRQQAVEAVTALAGVNKTSVILTAHSGAAEKPEPPQLKIGGHPKPQAAPMKPAGVARILAIASGKGGVGKSTVSSNLAVALAKQGRRVGLLDADIYGPSQPRMMGVQQRPASPDGKTIIPLQAHGVTMMSIGLMLDPDKAIVWRGPMLMGALQQMISQVAWGGSSCRATVRSLCAAATAPPVKAKAAALILRSLPVLIGMLLSLLNRPYGPEMLRLGRRSLC